MSDHLDAPTLAQIIEYYHPPLAQTCAEPDPQTEIVALATPCYEGIEPRCFDSHRYLVQQLAMDYGRNLWISPSKAGLPFSDAPLYSIACVFQAEHSAGRKADWLLWLDDDVSVPRDLMRILRASADPDDRPFVACVGHDRIPPFPPAVWQMENGKLVQWKSVPDKGMYRVYGTGLTAALFHRSLFARIPEPWFVTTARRLQIRGPKMECAVGSKPDTWWCNRLNQYGIPIYVNCDAKVTHFGLKLPVNSRTAPALRELSFLQNNQLEWETRGKPGTRDGCAVYAGLRQGTPSTIHEKPILGS